MYNIDQKKWFLEEMEKDGVFELPTIELIERIFVSAEHEENVFGKDVAEFTNEEVIDLLKSLNSTSRDRLIINSWYLEKYYDWCLNKGLVNNINNPFDRRVINVIIKDIIPDDVVKSKIITPNEFKEYISLEPDYVNKFILICPFYGIKGEEFNEIVNLKMTDLNENDKTVKLVTGKVVEVDDYFINHMKLAYNTKEYNRPYNGRNINQITYVQNGYVVRPCKSSTTKNLDEPVAYKFILCRVRETKKNIGNQEFTIANIFRSGLIRYLINKFDERGISFKSIVLNNDKTHNKDILDYCNQYGLATTTTEIRKIAKLYFEKDIVTHSRDFSHE